MSKHQIQRHLHMNGHEHVEFLYIFTFAECVYRHDHNLFVLCVQ